MSILRMFQEVQIPLLSALLLGGFATKVARAVRTGSVEEGLGPAALFQVQLRRPVAIAISALELGLGVGLIVTAGHFGSKSPATCIRLGTGLLFLVATCALIELRATRPEIGCGCFGEFSTTPVSWRTLTRSALLSVAALTTLSLPPVQQPKPGWQTVAMLAILVAELVVIAGLSPELGEALIRLGYSEPCELRVVPSDRTLAALRRSKQWRRHSRLITAEVPADVWRELCWRYLVFPARCGDREAEIVFGVFLRQRRPLIRTALIDAATGAPLAWPAPASRSLWKWRWPRPRPDAETPGPEPQRPAGGLPVSTGL
jgi:hypothetical protein